MLLPSIITTTPQLEMRPEHFKSLGIERSYWNADLTKVSPRGREMIQLWLSKLPQAVKEGRGMSFFGPFRGGKTAAMCIALREARCRGATVLCVSSTRIPTFVAGHHMYDDEETMDHRMRMVDVLGIDDLGKEHYKEGGTSIVEEIIRSRYGSGKSLLITTNEAEIVGQKYGDGIVSLIREKAPWVEMPPSDWFEKNKGETDAFFKG